VHKNLSSKYSINLNAFFDRIIYLSCCCKMYTTRWPKTVGYSLIAYTVPFEVDLVFNLHNPARGSKHLVDFIAGYLFLILVYLLSLLKNL